MSEKNSSYANNALLSLSEEIQHIDDNVSQSVVSVYSKNSETVQALFGMLMAI